MSKEKIEDLNSVILSGTVLSCNELTGGLYKTVLAVYKRLPNHYTTITVYRGSKTIMSVGDTVRICGSLRTIADKTIVYATYCEVI